MGGEQEKFLRSCWSKIKALRRREVLPASLKSPIAIKIIIHSCCQEHVLLLLLLQLDLITQHQKQEKHRKEIAQKMLYLCYILY